MTLLETIDLYFKSEGSFWKSLHIIEFFCLITLTLGVIYLIFTIRQYKNKLFYLKNKNTVSGTPNLYNFEQVAQKIINKNPDLNFVLIKIDIKQFTLLNNILGIKVGNKILLTMSSLFQQRVKSSIIRYFCHIVNDEFLILDSFADENKEVNKGKRNTFEDHVHAVLEADLQKYKIEFRFGRYYFDKGETDITSAIEKVNIAHNIAKLQTAKALQEYDGTFKERMLREKIIEREMSDALNNNEFEIYLQPKVLLENESIVAAEALVRWHKNGTIINPATFIYIFERNGFILKLDFYMLKKACRIIKKWQKEGKRIVPISINFSKLHLLYEDFVDNIIEITKQMDVDTKYIEIEITESVFIDNPKYSFEVLARLHNAGFVLAIDDFGTGYSSLGMMKNMYFSIIKIDKSFFDDESNKARSNIILGNILKMIKELNLHAVAEGVESERQLDNLRLLGCDMVQSYYYSKPIPAEEFDADMTIKHNFKDNL